MHYIEFPFPFDNRLTSQDILRTRREQLKLTQQQVAAGARLQLRQYQRIESGERNLENATLKTALSICAVLKLDPFTFLPEGELMNKYYELNNKETNTWATEELLTLLISQACDLYNEEFGTKYSLDNIKVAFCTLDNIVDVYREFTAKYGFHSEMKVLSDFESELAEAFIGQTDIDDPYHVDGILLRLDHPKEFSDQKYYQLVIVHELAHIFCTTHELETAGKAGQRFYDLFCEGKEGSPAENFNNGFISAGYAIWREFIAEVVSDIVYQQPSIHLNKLSTQLRSYAEKIRVGNPDSKLYIYKYLAEIMNSHEGGDIENWDDLEAILQELKLPFVNIVKHVFKILHHKCYVIDPYVIEELGSIYLAEVVKNTPTEELAKLAASYGMM